MSAGRPDGGIELPPEVLDALRSSSWTPAEVAAHLTGVAVPWCVAGGVVPELVLLFKAKHARPKDQTDFDATLDHLSRRQLDTLADLLATAYPGHHWLAKL